VYEPSRCLYDLPLCRESASFIQLCESGPSGTRHGAIDDFISLLKENEIKLLADVRAFPGSNSAKKMTKRNDKAFRPVEARLWKCC
jgi:hypothetical protein